MTNLDTGNPKTIYNYLSADNFREENNNDNYKLLELPLVKIKCESKNTATDWK